MFDVIPQLLARLTSIDSDHRIAKLGEKEFGAFAPPNLLTSIYPSRGCELNWENTGITHLETDWLVTACVFSNPRLRYHTKSAIIMYH